MTLTFTKGAVAGTWAAAGSIPSTFGSPVAFNGAANLTLTFDGSGVLTVPAADVSVGLTLTNGAVTPLTMNWNLVDATGSSYGDVTGYAADSNTTFQYQDGYPSGMLRDISVDEEGIVTAMYSNGEMIPYFQLALADFASYDGLTKMKDNLYAESLQSGQVLAGAPNNGRLGATSPGCLVYCSLSKAKLYP